MERKGNVSRQSFGKSYCVAIVNCLVSNYIVAHILFWMSCHIRIWPGPFSLSTVFWHLQSLSDPQSRRSIWWCLCPGPFSSEPSIGRTWCEGLCVASAASRKWIGWVFSVTSSRNFFLFLVTRTLQGRWFHPVGQDACQQSSIRGTLATVKIWHDDHGHAETNHNEGDSCHKVELEALWVVPDKSLWHLCSNLGANQWMSL